MDGRSPNPKIQRQVEQGKERYIPDHEKLTSIELNKIHGIIRRCYIALFEIKKKKVILYVSRNKNFTLIVTSSSEISCELKLIDFI